MAWQSPALAPGIFGLEGNRVGDCGLQPESTLESVVRAALQYFKNKLPLGICLKVPVL